MIYSRFALFVVCLAAFAAGLLIGEPETPAAQNPFISSEKSNSPPKRSPIVGYPAFLQPLMEKAAGYQRTIKQQMVWLAQDIRKHPFGYSFWGFMLLSFLYGVVHALGPGHGKIYTCSFFLSQPGTLKKVLLFANLTMLTHVFTGTLLILFGVLVLKTSGAMTLENSGLFLERFSYGLLAVVGFFIAGKIIREIRTGPGHFHDIPDRADMKSLVVTALAVGIVPCPGAALILLFSLTLGILTAGLWAMLCIAAGMTITTTVFAFGAIGFRRIFLSFVNGSDRIVSGAHVLLSFGGDNNSVCSQARHGFDDLGAKLAAGRRHCDCHA